MPSDPRELGRNHKHVYEINNGDDESSIKLVVAEPPGIKAEGLGLTTWGSSKVLANQLWYLRRHVELVDSPVQGPEGSSPLRRPSILELGAGTGLVGIAAAAVWRADVVLTDLPPIVRGTEASCALNVHLLSPDRASLVCGTLDWKEPSALQLSRTFTPRQTGEEEEASVVALQAALESSEPYRFATILSADTLYDEAQPPLLVDTVLTWLARSAAARVLVCYACRFAYMDVIRDFWLRMESAGLECFEERQESLDEDGGDKDWMEVGGTPYEWCVWRWKRV